MLSELRLPWPWHRESAAIPTRSATHPAYAGRRFLFISHDLSRTGAPLLLLETAKALIDSGASVEMAVASKVRRRNLASQFGVPLLSVDDAFVAAANVDVIIANTVSGATAHWVQKLLAKQPAAARRLVWWVHEIDVEAFAGEGGALKQAGLVIFDSKAVHSAWQEVTHLPPQVRVVHPALSDAFVEASARLALPFPMNPKARTQRPVILARDSIRRHLELSGDDFLLLSMGTFEPRKGQRMLIRTAAALAAETNLPIKLAIVGMGNRTDRAALLNDLTAQEKVVLAPSRVYMKQSDFAAFYLASDAFVMNSQGISNGRGEAFGRVTTEAMAFGLPVLGTAAGGTKEIIEDRVTGYLYPTGEDGQATLRTRIGELARDRSLATRLGIAGRRSAFARFRQRALLDQLANALDTIW